MEKTNSGLVAYCKAQVGLPYWYGTFGNKATSNLYYSKKKQYPDYYTATDFASQYGKRVHDCAGLVKGYLWSDTPTSTPTYKSSQDFGATGFYSSAVKKGTISSFDKVAGRLVFKSGSSGMKHVGVYIGNDTVIEAKGHAYGVIESKFTGGGWTHWAQCHLISEDAVKPEPEPKPEPTPTPEPTKKTVDELAKEVIEGKWGNGEERKKRLEAAGYSYAEVQARVNEILGINNKPSTPSSGYRYSVIAPHGLNIRKNKPTNTKKPYGEGPVVIPMNYGDAFFKEKEDGMWFYGYYKANGKTYYGWACSNNGIWLKKDF